MSPSRPVLIAGAGIGGLTAALALARRGFRVEVFDQSEKLEEAGAGVQLSPNAARILIALGLGGALEPLAVAPEELQVGQARSGRVITRAALGAEAAERYGAPYWVIHRGDLQAVLLGAVGQEAGIRLHLASRVEEFRLNEDRVTLTVRHRGAAREELGLALIGADGLWSRVRELLGHGQAPRFAGHAAWRALVPSEAAPPEYREPRVCLWLDRDAHFVHYPVKAGRLINVVAIARDEWRGTDWSAAGQRTELLDRFAEGDWHPPIRKLLAAGESWQKWALYDRAPLPAWGYGPVTLLGDAAHPMLPYLAQGAAMAIEDAVILADALGAAADDPAGALRRYEYARHSRTVRVQRAARRNGALFHLGGPLAFGRNAILTMLGGARLIAGYDWLYGWEPPPGAINALPGSRHRSIR